MEDRYGNWWHTATMQISKNHDMERRVGIWRAGFDKDGVLFCNQQFGDWPMAVEQAKEEPWAEPEWYLLSYQKAMTASSSEEGREPSFATDENIQTWWRAAGNQPGEWISMDLGEVKDVRAVQINFADDKIDAPLPGERQGNDILTRASIRPDGCLRHPPMEQTILFWQINQTQKPICRMISS